MSFLNEMKIKAKANKKNIVLPESGDERTIVAMKEIVKEDLANLILVGNEEELKSKYADADFSNVTVLDFNTYDRKEEFINELVEIRKSKGLTAEDAEKLLQNELYFGVMLVKMGVADGMVAGAANSTANVLRPSLQILKTKPGSKIVSSFMVMEVPNCEYGENGLFAFSDIGIVPNPNADELADIAVTTADSFSKLAGVEPRVGMLSFSTLGSAKCDLVDKVIEATKIAKENAPELKLDGEFQLDAAIVPSVGEKKAPGNAIAGKANVLIFPDLQAGNIGYKLVQRLAKAEAYGPIIQGISKPVNDLSRGCSADDIVAVTAITAVQC
ncbi:MAG: phosphate acetyltransferase [Clostridia bacterium]|jgi:phosphate acetyltransferase|nr:phosphate acetyltransferase [Clostridia bacterium]